MVICLERGVDLHTAQLMPLPLTVSCFSKIQIGFTFLVPAQPGSPGKRAVKRVLLLLLLLLLYCTALLLLLINAFLFYSVLFYSIPYLGAEPQLLNGELFLGVTTQQVVVVALQLSRRLLVASSLTQLGHEACLETSS